MRIAALDLGASTGVACGSAGEAPALATWNLRADTLGERAVTLMGHLRQLFGDYKPDRVYLEAPMALMPMMKVGATSETIASLYGYNCLVLAVAHEFELATESVNVQAVRKHFLGYFPRGGEGKARVFARCQQLGWAPFGKDQSDAAALWDYACAMEDVSAYIKARSRQSVGVSVR